MVLNRWNGSEWFSLFDDPLMFLRPSIDGVLAEFGLRFDQELRLGAVDLSISYL